MLIRAADLKILGNPSLSLWGLSRWGTFTTISVEALKK